MATGLTINVETFAKNAEAISKAQAELHEFVKHHLNTREMLTSGPSRRSSLVFGKSINEVCIDSLPFPDLSPKKDPNEPLTTYEVSSLQSDLLKLERKNRGRKRGSHNELAELRLRQKLAYENVTGMTLREVTERKERARLDRLRKEINEEAGAW